MKTEKSIFVIAFDAGAKGTRYVDEDISDYGCSETSSAKEFDTKEEAESFMNKHEYAGWVEEIK